MGAGGGRGGRVPIYLRLEENTEMTKEATRFKELAEWEKKANEARACWPWGEQLFNEQVISKSKNTG